MLPARGLCYCAPMLSVLANRTYRRLFAAQAISLAGTGLATVALALLAFDLAGDEAGRVLGTALAIKMIAYVSIAPVVGAFAASLPRRAFLVGLDIVRAAIAVLLPFIDQVWQIYLLVFLLQSASAGFTPTFQATIPDVLPEERDYTRALSLSRLAYDLESLLSPTVAAVLLMFVSFHWLFGGTAIGFLISAALVLSVRLPQPEAEHRTEGIYDKLTRGVRIYLKTPRLQGLLALNLSAAAAGAMVIVNTVVIVRSLLGGSETDVAVALAAFGGGSMIVALMLPKILDYLPDRPVMLLGGAALPVLMLGLSVLMSETDTETTWASILVVWLLLGAGYSAILTPAGRLLRRSAHAQDRPTLFAAQFALSHACWLVAYPLAGWLGQSAGMRVTLVVMAMVTAVGTILASRLWPSSDPDEVLHEHADLPTDHPHLRTASGRLHEHQFIIDDLHPHWPQRHA
jgi:MFS family permease